MSISDSDCCFHSWLLKTNFIEPPVSIFRPNHCYLLAPSQFNREKSETIAVFLVRVLNTIEHQFILCQRKRIPIFINDQGRRMTMDAAGHFLNVPRRESLIFHFHSIHHVKIALSITASDLQSNIEHIDRSASRAR